MALRFDKQCRWLATDVLPLRAECILKRPKKRARKCIVVGRTREADPRYDVLCGSERIKNIPGKWLEVDDGL